MSKNAKKGPPEPRKPSFGIALIPLIAMGLGIPLGPAAGAIGAGASFGDHLCGKMNGEVKTVPPNMPLPVETQSLPCFSVH